MGRWAYGDEVACGSGGCRNLAEWILRQNDPSYHRYGASPSRVVCAVHLHSAVEVWNGRYRMPHLLSVLPFQDPTERPRRKRRQQHPIG